MGLERWTQKKKIYKIMYFYISEAAKKVQETAEVSIF